MSEVFKGRVKWFSEEKGYGFIKPDGGGEDVFVHKSALDMSGIHAITENDAVEYSTEVNRGKTRACDILLV